jgi:hypothetical protein
MRTEKRRLITVANGAPIKSPGDDPLGSVEAARFWLDAVVIRRDLASAWDRGTDPDYRLALVQATIFLNDDSPLLKDQDRDRLEKEMAKPSPNHPLWPSFAALLVEEFLQAFGDLDPETLKTAVTRPVASGYELVLFPQNGEDADEPKGMQSRGVLVHLRENRWVVAGLSERPAVPGRPPDLGY